MEMELSRLRLVTKRLRQSGNASADNIQFNEQAVTEIEQALKDHKIHATETQTFYRQTIVKCSKTWNDISALMAKISLSTEEGELASKKQAFTLVLSANYQQPQLIPYWGSSVQPGCTYYLQKVSHDVLGIVEHRDGQQHITLFDERIGPENTDHTISIIQGYIDKVAQLHPWIQKVLLLLDNAANTNKSCYLFCWGMELVE